MVEHDRSDLPEEAPDWNALGLSAPPRRSSQGSRLTKVIVIGSVVMGGIGGICVAIVALWMFWRMDPFGVIDAKVENGAPAPIAQRSDERQQGLGAQEQVNDDGVGGSAASRSEPSEEMLASPSGNGGVAASDAEQANSSQEEDTPAEAGGEVASDTHGEVAADDAAPVEPESGAETGELLTLPQDQAASTSFERLPLPTGPDLERELRKIDDQYRSQYLGLANLDSDEKEAVYRRVTRELLDASVETVDPVKRYALLRRAIDWATRTGHHRWVFQLIDYLDEFYQIDPLAERVDAIAEWSTYIQRSKDQGNRGAWNRGMLMRASSVVERAEREGRPEVVVELLKMLLQLHVVPESGMSEYLKERLERAERMMAARRRVKELEQQLDKQDDAVSRLTLGKLLCFTLDDWERGLPYLARSADRRLKVAAELDLQGAETVEQIMAIGDAWWELAQAALGSQRDGLARRAQFWHRQALVGSSN